MWSFPRRAQSLKAVSVSVQSISLPSIIVSVPVKRSAHLFPFTWHVQAQILMLSLVFWNSVTILPIVDESYLFGLCGACSQSYSVCIHGCFLVMSVTTELPLQLWHPSQTACGYVNVVFYYFATNLRWEGLCTTLFQTVSVYHDVITFCDVFIYECYDLSYRAVSFRF